FLSSLTNQQIQSRWERDRRIIDTVPDLETAMIVINQARSRGVAIVHGGVFAEASAIARLVNYELDGRQLVVSIAGPETRIRANQPALVDLLLEPRRM
ncbi:MAG: hypothetical protein ACT6R2_21015, partial [Blastomonas fulva]|uniref:hypothetical protein n=1 Tax=Blastomonas fulva TaxID=1550728 RepID=UPI004034D819